jgi:hypothetical protein
MKPTEEDLLADYLNAVDSLTINTEPLLQKQVDRIKQETKDSEYIIRGKLQERDDQIQKLMKKQEHFEQMIQSFIDSGQLSVNEVLSVKK